MKFFTKLFVLALAVVTIFTFSACKNDEKAQKTELNGWALDISSEVVKEDDRDVKVLTVKSMYVAPGTLNEVDSGIAKKIDLTLGYGLPFNVYDEKTDDFALENGKIKQDNFDNYDRVIIDRDAFANQKFIGSVQIDKKVTEIGIGAFAGCSNLTMMRLPFVGVKADGVYNVNKTFAVLFGTVETTDCTSVTVTYNEGNTATYYIPSKLTEVVVNYAEDAMLPAYAFAGNTVVKTVKLSNVTEVGNNAFMGCSSLNTVDFGDTDGMNKLQVIGKEGFSGCSSLYNFNLSKFENLNTVYQSAFEGCSKLGLGFAEVVLPAADYMDRAFANCTTLKVVNFQKAKSLGTACFYGCTALETLNNIETVKMGNHVFIGCTKLMDANTVTELGELNVVA